MVVVVVVVAFVEIVAAVVGCCGIAVDLILSLVVSGANVPTSLLPRISRDGR